MQFIETYVHLMLSTSMEEVRQHLYHTFYYINRKFKDYKLHLQYYLAEIKFKDI